MDELESMLETADTATGGDFDVGVFGDDLVSDADIVPDDYQRELITWRDVFLGGAFRIGDIANELIEKQRAKRDIDGLRITSKRIYRAVGRFCGKSGRTIRYYGETASFFSEEIRQKYQVVPFSHFVLAKSMGNWEEVLDYVSANPDCTAEMIMREFSQDKPESRAMEGDLSTLYFGNIGVVVSPDTVIPPDWDSHDEICEVSQNKPSRAEIITRVGDLVTAIDGFERYVAPLLDEDDAREIVEASRYLRSKLAKLTV